MFGELVKWVKDNRFLLVLTALLLLGAFLTFVLGRNPTESIADTFQGLWSNLTAEIGGAIAAIWLIDSLLKRHQAHSLRDVHILIAEAVRLAVYETISKVVGAIADPKYGVMNSTAFNELLGNIFECRPQEALSELERLIQAPYYPPLDPQAYIETKNMAFKQLKEWTDFQIRFQQYLSPSQFTSCAKIVDLLKDIYSHSAEVERLFQRLDDTSKSLQASQMAPQLADELECLARENLELLRISSA
jgi:hypothetical protein